MPSYEEIAAYAAERNSILNPKAFYDHYQANGWTHNGSPVYNWRALFQSWERVEKKKQKPQVLPQYSEPAEEEEEDEEERAALIADIELAKEAIRVSSTLEEANQYYKERTKWK
ncbi:MAG: hypothetical protein IIZ34_03665 [Eubacterium sp.]|nr:hypothetical protein [Eubacterium sp.]